MLTLKRRIHNTISIVFHEKARAPTRFLFRGIIIALLFHFLILFVFQIRVKYVDDETSQNAPTVFLDPEETFISLISDSSEDIASKVTRDLHFSYNPFVIQSPLLPVFEEEEVPQKNFQKVLLLPWSLSCNLSPSSQIVHAYPLKIIFSDELQQSVLINDGSSLFKKASYDSLFSTPLFAESQPRVDFLIEVSALDTKITKVSCIRELLDKRLQELALKILFSLRFAPRDKTVQGKISLQFSGTFDTIAPFLGGSFS